MTSLDLSMCRANPAAWGCVCPLDPRRGGCRL